MKRRFGKVMLVGALALVAALFIVCIPASAGAADVAEVTAGGTTKKYDNFADAWTAAKTAEAATVKLLANVDKGNHTPWPITVARGMEITLDLNGFDIDRGLTAEAPDGNVITVSGILTLNDSSGGNGAITGGYNSYNGGGVRVIDGGAFTMNGGTISSNKAGSTGGGVYMAGSTFIMNSGTISNNTAASLNGGGVYMYASTFEMWGGTIYGNTADNGGGVAVFDGTFTMSDGAISGNTAGSSGGAVSVFDGTFTMSDGTISGNTAGSVGGGVYVFYFMYISEFEMSGGTIYGNTATNDGGGVYIDGGTFTMSDGTISGNTAGSNGGGVSVLDNGTFEMTGGTISGNTATDDGGGIYHYNNGITSSGWINLSGTPVITGNVKGGVISGGVLTGGTANNLYLPTGETATIGAGGWNVGATIGVTTQDDPTSAAVPVTGASSANYKQYFKSDNTAFSVLNIGKGNAQSLYLAKLPLTLSIHYKDEGDNDYSGNNASDLIYTHTIGAATTLVDGAKDDKIFGGWFTTSDCQTGTDIATLGAYDFATNITLYAKWTEYTHTITATAGANGTITPSGDVDVTEGEDQTFTIVADAGYQIADVSVDGNSEGDVGTYTFTNVTTSHTISATFEQIHTPPINITPAAIITQGSAPANLTINIGGAGSPPNDPAHFGSLEISANGSGFTTVGSGNYTLSFSSIHIALNQSWLNTLAPGAYTLRVNLAGAYAGISLTTQLTVTTPPPAPPAPPKTGDNSQPLIWLSLCGLGLIGIGILVSRRRRRA